MANLNIPVGVSDFAEIRKNGYYFIDKSELIEKLVKTKATKVTLLTRPRRFGKTLGMSMLANFFDIRKDSHEFYYHAFLAGIFIGIGYAVESNREHGTERSDIVIADPSNMRVVIFEVKIAEDRRKLERECEEALTQIQNRSYAEEFLENGNEVLCYGIAFYKKECLVKRIE